MERSFDIELKNLVDGDCEIILIYCIGCFHIRYNKKRQLHKKYRRWWSLDSLHIRVWTEHKLEKWILVSYDCSDIAIVKQEIFGLKMLMNRIHRNFDIYIRQSFFIAFCMRFFAIKIFSTRDASLGLSWRMLSQYSPTGSLETADVSPRRRFLRIKTFRSPKQ